MQLQRGYRQDQAFDLAPLAFAVSEGEADAAIALLRGGQLTGVHFHENLLDPLSLLPELRWDRVRIAPQSARATGVEVLLSRKSASAWNGWLNYAWSTVEDREGGIDTRRGWDQKHAFGGGLSWTSDPWIATLAATWHSGWPTTSVRLAEPIDTPPEVLIGTRNDVRFKDFLSIDARLSASFRCASS